MTDEHSNGQTGASVETHNLRRVFRDPTGSEFIALDDVNLTIGSGKFVSIVGPSGCGKTTLLRIVMGLDEATSGSVAVRSEGADDTKSATARRSFVFQRPALLPWRTVQQNVTFGLDTRAGRKIHPDRTSRSNHLENLLELTGLTRFRDYYPAQISGGMQQRANLARALAVDPNILLMDEPFSALDAMTKERLQRELASIVSHLEATVLFVTHDIREAVFLSDRIAVMATDPGRVVKVVDVDAPTERDAAFQHSDILTEQARAIWAMLDEQKKDPFSE